MHAAGNRAKSVARKQAANSTRHTAVRKDLFLADQVAPDRERDASAVVNVLPDQALVVPDVRLIGQIGAGQPYSQASGQPVVDARHDISTGG